MLKTLIIKEIREMIGSPKFVFTFAVCALLIIGAFYVGASNYRINRAGFEASQAQNLRQMEGLTDWLDIEQHRIFMPPHPLASLVSGVSNDIGRTVEMGNRAELTSDGSRYNEEPIFAVFRFLDLEFVFQVVLALLAILLGYDAVSGEKERGTLRLVFSNAVSRSTFILGKLIGSFLGLAAGLLIAIGLGCLLLPIMGVPLSGADWLKLALIAVAGLLYFGVFLTLAIFVSAATRRSSSSFLVLLVIWISAVLIVPRASVLIAGRAVEVPSVDELATQKSIFAAGLWDEFRTGMQTFDFSASSSATVYDEYGEQPDPEAGMRQINQHLDSLGRIRETRMNEFAGRLNEQRHNAQRQQERLALSIARLSPATSLSLAASRLAGTSIDLKDRLQDAAVQYQETYRAFLKEKTGMNIGGARIVIRTSDEADKKPEPINPYEMPTFNFPQPEVATVLQASLLDLGLLALFNLLCFAGAFVAFLRYDLR